jgi:inositol transport system substrate-binding protein
MGTHFAYPEMMHLPSQSDKNKSKRYIYIMLLNYPDRFSRVFRFFSRCKFSHASIGVSDTDWTFFSYVLKGFRKELPKKHPTFKKQEVLCRLYRVEVSDEVYNKTKAALEDHASRAHDYKFSYLGFVLCVLRIVYPLKGQYICSQFVSEILEQTNAVPLKKHSSLYLPDDFTKMSELDLCYSGYLSQLYQPANLNKLTLA